MLRRFAFVLLSCMALAIPASAQNTVPEKPVVKLGIGGKIQMPYLAVNIAQESGYFKEQGLTVEFNEFRWRLGFAQGPGRRAASISSPAPMSTRSICRRRARPSRRSSCRTIPSAS